MMHSSNKECENLFGILYFQKEGQIFFKFLSDRPLLKLDLKDNYFKSSFSKLYYTLYKKYTSIIKCLLFSKS